MLTCKRCGESWSQRIQNPRVCPKCHNAWWDVDRGSVSRKARVMPAESIKQEPVYTQPMQPAQPIYAQPIYNQVPIQPDPPIQISQPAYQPRPPQMPENINPPEEFYEGQHPQRIQKGREAIETMMNDLHNPRQTSIDPDKDMSYPIRKCKLCGHVDIAPKMLNHKCT